LLEGRILSIPLDNNTLWYYIITRGDCQAFFRQILEVFLRNNKVMRIDKFLKVSRILKRRAVAQEACQSEKVFINGKPVKPAHPVAVGDEVELQYTRGSIKFRVLNIKETVKKDEAASLYEIIQ